jgi:hypothetical protein
MPLALVEKILVHIVVTEKHVALRNIRMTFEFDGFMKVEPLVEGYSLICIIFNTL